MKIIGIILMIVFGITALIKLLTLPQAIEISKGNYRRGGFLFALWRSVSVELFCPGGLFFSIIMILIGYYLFTK